MQSVAWLADLPSAPVLLSGNARGLRAFRHALLADAVHATNKAVLVLDGAHCINPHEIGFAHLQRGYAADYVAALHTLRRAGHDVQPGQCVQYVVQRGTPGVPEAQRVAPRDMPEREPIVDRGHYAMLLERSVRGLWPESLG